MHITAFESSEWQRLGKVDSDAFEKAVTGPKPSVHAILVKHGGKKLPSKIAVATTLIEGLAKDLNQLRAASQTEIKKLLAAIDKLYDVLPVHQTNGHKSEDQLLSKLKQIHR